MTNIWLTVQKSNRHVGRLIGNCHQSTDATHGTAVDGATAINGKGPKQSMAKQSKRSRKTLEKQPRYLQGIPEEFLGPLKRNVLERVRIDFYDAILDGDAAVAMDATAGFDALNEQSHFGAERRIIRNDVDAQRTPFVG